MPINLHKAKRKNIVINKRDKRKENSLNNKQTKLIKKIILLHKQNHKNSPQFKKKSSIKKPYLTK